MLNYAFTFLDKFKKDYKDAKSEQEELSIKEKIQLAEIIKAIQASGKKS